MPMTAYREFPSAGVVALFDEAPGGGDPKDFTSLRNRPARFPESWLANVYLHNQLDNMEVLLDQTVVINHGAFASASGEFDAGTGATDRYDTDATLVDFDLVDHDLGYEPIALVALDDDILTPGYPVQLAGVVNGSGRYCCPFVTATKVRLREYRTRAVSGLPAVSRSYRVLVIRQARAPAGDMLREFDPTTGALSLGRDTFNSGRRYLQVVPGGSPFGLSYGRTMDAKRGAPRFVAPDGTIFDPIPITATIKFTNGAQPNSDPFSYNGTFAGDGAIQVQAP